MTRVQCCLFATSNVHNMSLFQDDSFIQLTVMSQSWRRYKNPITFGQVSQGGTIWVFLVISEGCMAIACINHGILYITGKLIFLSINLCYQIWSVLQNNYVSQLELLKNRWFLHVLRYVRVKKNHHKCDITRQWKGIFLSGFFTGMPLLYWMSELSF